MRRTVDSSRLPPNNSFKPNLLRYTKHMSEKACHVFGSTTQVGLTQALGFMPNTSTIRITVDRDSVCAGDDVISHEAMFSIGSSCNVFELLSAALRACPLASIAGGQATWLIDVPDSKNCI